LLEHGFVIVPNEKTFAQQSLESLKRLPVESEKKTAPRLCLPCRNMVRHTFIQISSTEGSSKRARSVPKDVGSRVTDIVEASAWSDDDDSTDVGSGALSPTLTASPAWSPRIPVDDINVPCPGFRPLEELPFDAWHCDGSPFATAMMGSVLEMPLGTCDASAFEFPLLARAFWDPIGGHALQMDHSMIQPDYGTDSADFGAHIRSWADASSPTSPLEGVFAWTPQCVNHDLSKPILCLSECLQGICE